MIEINLLAPHRAKKKKRRAEVGSQLIVAAIVFSITVLVCGYFVIRLNDRVDELKSDSARLTEELNSLKAKVKEVKNFERNKKVVQDKIEIIKQLRKNQSVPVHLLDEISKSLPNRSWLVGLTEQNGTFDITGKAITNSEIVEFNNRLKRSFLFKDVEILESRGNLEGNIPIYSFRLSGKIS